MFRGVDFLIVTILADERVGVLLALGECTQEATGWVGSVPGVAGGSRTVAVVEVGAQGQIPAEQATAEAIRMFQPRHGVLLVGISAGFPESGVGLGDVLVPNKVVNYEPAKLRDASTTLGRLLARLGLGRGQAVTEEHRAYPEEVTPQLWQTAKNVARRAEQLLDVSSLPNRPDGRKALPTVHCERNGLVGSGSKLVAAKQAKERQWLLAEYQPGSSVSEALGLEMEGYGVMAACKAAERRFLMVKGVQDSATGAKDVAGAKDAWRNYACVAAARFAVAVVAQFAQPQSLLADQHLDEAAKIAPRLMDAVPSPRFDYRVSISSSPLRLHRHRFDVEGASIAELVPDDAVPRVVLRGGGGAGKTTVMWMLFQRILDAGLCPVLLDLKRAAYRDSDTTIPDMDTLIGRCSVPRRTLAELEELARESRVVLLIDGMNEVGEEARDGLLRLSVRLADGGHCLLVATDRLGPRDWDTMFTRHALLDKLRTTDVKRVWQAAGRTDYEELPAGTRRALSRPFFLHMALRTEPGKRRLLFADFFEDFFDQHSREGLAVSPGELDSIAEACVDAFAVDGSFRTGVFEDALDARAKDVLSTTGVWRGDSAGFEHDLWRDYFVARRLSGDRALWTYSTLNKVTSFANSLECLMMTAEQLRSAPDRDGFIRDIYDWNWPAAGRCASQPYDAEQERFSAAQTAVMAMVGEKRFDPITNTSERAERSLDDSPLPLVSRILACKSRDELVELVSGMEYPDAWFGEWSVLFAARDGWVASPDQVQLIGQSDPLLGWTASNALRRSAPSEDLQGEIRRMLQATDADERVRWRAVNTLGAFPNRTNVDALLTCTEQDESHWVKYGSIRALMEIARQSKDPGLRGLVASGLRELLPGLEAGQPHRRDRLLNELVLSAIAQPQEPDWIEFIGDLLLEVAGSMSPTVRDEAVELVRSQLVPVRRGGAKG